MSQYQTGTVNVTNGSATVTGTGTSWLANVSIGDLFMVRGINTHYEVATVVDNDEITLNANWAGSTLTDQLYEITRDFTSNLNLPEISAGDRDWAFNLTVALRMIDLAIGDLSGLTLEVTDHGTDTTVVLTTDDLNKIHLFSNTATCTVTLPSIDSNHIGYWIEFRKKGSGNLVINTSDSDTIFTTDTTISNTNTAPEIDFLALLIETASHYGCRGMYGVWTTS